MIREAYNFKNYKFKSRRAIIISMRKTQVLRIDNRILA